MKKISVIVPVYNTEKYLYRCIDSIRMQTYKDLEIILVDDGSLDHCPDICDKYAQFDDRIIVVHKNNEGVATARNVGLDIATGDYITFVDSDDYIKSTMYQAMMEKVEQYDCDVIMCDCVKEYEEKSEVYTHASRPGYYTRTQLEKEYFPNLLIMPNVEYPPTISNWLCLFKNRDTKLRYVEGIRFSEDLLFGAELMYQAQSFYYMKGCCFYHYWMNPQSVTHRFAADKWADYKSLHERIEEKFSSCIEYDFSKQVELVLLFFVYNAIGDIVSTSQLGKYEKLQKCRIILSEDRVRQMFSKIKILKLPISFKLKVLTVMYKYKIGIRYLILKAN